MGKPHGTFTCADLYMSPKRIGRIPHIGLCKGWTLYRQPQYPKLARKNWRSIMCRQESLGRSAPFEPSHQTFQPHTESRHPGGTTIPLADRDWDLEVYPQTVAGHGVTGRWSWAIVKRSETRPRIRYGTSRTRELALFDVGFALGELVSD